MRLARDAATSFLTDGTIIKPPTELDRRAGVFVTLNFLTRKKEEHLRGCIGFPIPYKSLRESVVEASIAAATADPRFPPVDLPELRQNPGIDQNRQGWSYAAVEVRFRVAPSASSS